jgi:hypothetical protein
MNDTMTQSASSAAQTRSVRIRRAASGGLPLPPDTCADCVKTGLAILPLVARPAQTSRTDALKKRSPAFAAACAQVENRLAWSTPESAAWYFLRSVPLGYVYVLKTATKSWDAYAVGEDGLLQRFAVDDLPESPDEVNLSQTCKRSGHSNVRPQFFVVDPLIDTEVFVAYSPHRWTRAVRKRFEDNTDNCRARMARVDVSAAQKGQVGPSTTDMKHAMVATPSAFTGVADHASAAFRDALNEHLFLPVRGRESETTDLCKAMDKASELTSGKHGIALLLTDAIGIAEDLNLMRLRVIRDEQEWVAGGPDANGANADLLRPWKRQSAVHVGYIEAWLLAQETDREKGNSEALKRMARQLRDDQFAYSLLTEEEFERRYGELVRAPLQKGKGMNPWSGARWEPYHDASGAPDSTGLGTAVLSDAYYQARAESMGKAAAEDKMQRYRKRLRGNGAELQAFNQAYEAAQQEWLKLVERLDAVYIDYLEKRWSFEAVLTHDFDDGKTLAQAAANTSQARVHLQDALARLRATERALGGAVVSDISLQYLAKQLDKPVDDKTNWIAKALFKDFDLMGAVKDESTTPDIYDIGINGPQVPRQLREAVAGFSESIEQAQNMALLMQQVVNRLRIKELAGGKASGLTARFTELAGKEMVWVRATALYEYLKTTKKHYSVRLEWKIGDYLDAQLASLETPGFSISERPPASRRQVRSDMFAARKRLEKLVNDPALQGKVMVPLIVEANVAGKAAGTGDELLQVYSDNLLGHPAPMRTLPRSVARDLMTSRGAWQRGDVVNKLFKMEVGLSTGAMVFGIFEINAALGKIAEKGGLEQADAIASLMSGVTGTVGGAAEIGAYWVQSAAAAGTQATGAVLASTVRKALAIRLGAGALGAAGAFADMASSFIKHQKSLNAGESDAARHYAISTGFLLSSGVLSAGGAIASWRAALAARAGTQILVSLGRGMVLRTAVAGLLGSWWTGIGLVLFAAGIIWAIYAQSLEHDDNERFLDRGFWGKHEGKDEYPPYGGEQGAVSQDAWMANGLSEELLALATLALGIKGAFDDWNDERRLFNKDARDIVTATLSFGNWKPEQMDYSYSLEGLPTRSPGVRGTVLYTGPGPGDVVLANADNPRVHEIKVAFRVDEDKHPAVRLNFALHAKGSSDPLASGYAYMEND